MKTLVIPFGADGWREKQRIFDGLITERSGPPFLYNDVLLLVPSARLRRTYGRQFLDRATAASGAAAVAPPDIQTLHQFLQRLHARAGGPALIDENGRLVLLEGIVTELLGRTTRSGVDDVIAPSLSAAVAAMIEELSAAAVDPERLAAAVAEGGLGDKMQVTLLVRAYARYRDALAQKGLADPSGMLARLADRFDPSWLAPYSSIIIDGLHDAGELEARVLRRIASHRNCLFLIDAPAPDRIRNAGDQHPLRLVKELLGKTGLTAGDASAQTEPADAYLAGALFATASFGETARTAPRDFREEVRLLSAISMREEVSLIARRVKRSLAGGSVPESILVAFPSLDEYGPLAEEIFRDYGIPYNRALGRQLSTSPVTTAVISLLTACQEDFSGPSLFRVFSSPFLKFSEDPSLAPALDRFLRLRRLLGGKDRLLAALGRHAPAEDGFDALGRSLADLAGALDPFFPPAPAPLGAWMNRLADLLAWSGLADRVELIKGPLNMNLQAHRKLHETIASLRQAGSLFPEQTYTFSEWLFLLKRTFMHARFQVPPDDEGGVQVLGLEEAAGHAWSEIFLGGLIDGQFPRRRPQNIFLPEATLETLGVRTLENARLNAAYHFYRLLLSSPSVTLTWPENQGERPVVPSPFLEELRPLRMAGLLNRGEDVVSGIQFSFTVGESRSVPELAKAVGFTGDAQGLDAILTSELDGMQGIRTACTRRPPEPPVASPPQPERIFRVTDLDTYLRCPYDYFVKEVLRIEPLQEVTEDISPLDRGTRVHGILREFYRAWDRPVTAENREEARSLLASLAERAFRQEADTFRNRREKELFLSVMTTRFLDAEILFWEQGLRPAYLEQDIEGFELALADGTRVELHGRIDRIDADENGGFIIVDYKTGGYPQPATSLDQPIFQLPVYAVMAQQSLAGKGPALTRPIGLAYYDLSGRTGGPARDVVLFDRETRTDHPATKPKASPKSRAEFEQILSLSMDKARRAAEGILRGEFPAVPQEENRCRSCPNEPMCRNAEAGE